MTHEEKVARWIAPSRRKVSASAREFGAEIGAFKTPVSGIRPFYIDRFAVYAGEKALADYRGDLCSLPFRNHSLDYVVASHVLEHVANPVKALWECARVVRHGGILYFVVPDRRYTFDHTRQLTTVEHMMSDFDRGTNDSDPTHIGEYLDGIDWTRWNPTATAAENAAARERLRASYLHSARSGKDINIHFHTFERRNIVELLDRMNVDARRPCTLELVDHAEQFPRERGDGLLVVLRVLKAPRHRLAGRLNALRTRGDSDRALRPGAQKFSEADFDLTPPRALAHIDSPANGQFSDPRQFVVEGWTHAVPPARVQSVELWFGEQRAGDTSELFFRLDVNAAFSLAPDLNTGFRLVASYQGTPVSSVCGELRVVLHGGETGLRQEHTFAFRPSS